MRGNGIIKAVRGNFLVRGSQGNVFSELQIQPLATLDIFCLVVDPNNRYGREFCLFLLDGLESHEQFGFSFRSSFFVSGLFPR